MPVSPDHSRPAEPAGASAGGVASTHARALIDLLRASAAPPRAKVERMADPKIPGRTGYRISGPTRQSVSREIAALVAAVDAAGGFAQFVGPHRVDDGFGALGETLVPQAAS